MPIWTQSTVWVANSLYSKSGSDPSVIQIELAFLMIHCCFGSKLAQSMLLNHLVDTYQLSAAQLFILVKLIQGLRRRLKKGSLPNSKNCFATTNLCLSIVYIVASIMYIISSYIKIAKAIQMRALVEAFIEDRPFGSPIEYLSAGIEIMFSSMLLVADSLLVSGKLGSTRSRVSSDHRQGIPLLCDDA